MIRKSITNMFAFCILAIPIISSADDIELLVDKSMGQKALNAVDFPLEVRFPLNRASLSEETYSLGEADIGDIEFLSPGQDINLVESSDLSEAFEKAILSTVKSYRDGSLNIKDLESDERKAIELISKGSKENALSLVFVKLFFCVSIVCATVVNLLLSELNALNSNLSIGLPA